MAMSEEVVKMIEEIVCSYFRNVCGWSCKETTDLIADLYTTGKADSKSFGLMSTRDQQFIELVMLSASEAVSYGSPQCRFADQNLHRHRMGYG